AALAPGLSAQPVRAIARRHSAEPATRKVSRAEVISASVDPRAIPSGPKTMEAKRKTTFTRPRYRMSTIICLYVVAVMVHNINGRPWTVKMKADTQMFGEK